MNRYAIFYRKGSLLRSINIFSEPDNPSPMDFTFEGNILADNLDDVYHVLQNLDEHHYAAQRLGHEARSMSVGDIILDLSSGKYYMVLGVGFGEFWSN